MSKNEANYSMPIKKAYSSHIKESREHALHEIIYEFLDDHSYTDASYASLHIKTIKKGDKDMTMLYVCMEDGPSDLETLNKLVQWRVSGKSKETGHRGGGNKRFIYEPC